jgi:hypothetical protein
LRFTRRGVPLGDEVAFGGPSLEPSPLAETSASFGGVLLERFGGVTGRGMSRRVTMPWPVVQRFVVNQ